MGKIDLALAPRPAPPPPVASAATPGSAALAALVQAIADGAAARDRNEASPQAAIDLAREARLGAFRLSRAEGGGGASLVELFQTVIDLAAADSNIPHILRNHFAFVEVALRQRQDPRYARWLEEIRQGKLFGSGSSELGTQNIGARSFETRLAPRGDDYVLNGTKYYSTGNFYADFLFITASLEDGRPVSAMISRWQDGVTVEEDWDGIGQRLTASGTTVLRDVAVHRQDVVFPGETGPTLPYTATFAQLYLTTIIAGILRNILADATALVQQRGRNYYHAVSAQPAADPFLQQGIGRLASIAYVAEASVLRAAEALGDAYRSAIEGTPDAVLFREASLRAAKSKVIVDELALNAATQLFDVGGASAARQSARLDRHWRNIRTLSSHNPVSYKARAIGDLIVNGTALPNAAFF